MKVIHKDQTEIFKTDQMQSLEYPLKNKNINIAHITLNGRYPEEGKAINTKCDEILYILKGSGKLHIEKDSTDLKEESAAIIDKGEPYYIEGDNLEMIVPCTPAWTPEQQEHIE